MTAAQQATRTFRRGDWCIHCWGLWIMHADTCPVRALVEGER